tara:strand:- start:15 stop:287 length:273 start_codon:yes stop_codon:yes gene_type:complete
MTKINKDWITYHATRLNLIESIESHLESLDLVNVYNNGSRSDIPLNTSGDYGLMNEQLGYDKMVKLLNKLHRDTDKEKIYPDETLDKKVG